MEKTLLLPREVDELLRYPRGRSARLARADRFPHVLLPDGEVRFDPDVIRPILTSRGAIHVECREVLAHA